MPRHPTADTPCAATESRNRPGTQDRRISLSLLLLCAMSAGAAVGAEVRVSWRFATNNLDGTPLTDLAGAKVYYGTASSNYTRVVDVPGGQPGQTCAFSVTGLVEGVTYYLNGTAYNTAGLESDFCNEIARVASSADTTPPTITPPGAVTLVADGAGHASIPDLVSTATVSDNRSSPTAITVTQSPSAGTVVGVGTHTVTLTATDEAGNASQASVTVLVVPALRPNAPANLRLVPTA